MVIDIERFVLRFVVEVCNIDPNTKRQGFLD